MILAAVTAAVALAAAPPPNDSGPLPELGGITNVSRVEPKLSAAATRIAGRPVEFRCWSPDSWAQLALDWKAYSGRDLAGVRAYTRASDPLRVQASPRTCGTLIGFLYLGERPKEPRARADLADELVTVAHEAFHLAGVPRTEEPRAECWAAQRIRPLARMLGASKNYAAALAVAWWRYIYLPSRGGPLWSAECRNGGTLDLNPRATAWP